MIIGIDFDGTCVTHEYPFVGKDIGAVPVLKDLVKAGHQLILYTMRSEMPGISPVTHKLENGGLQDAINWFKENGIDLFAVQTNPTQHEWTSSPKCYFHLCIDDNTLGAPLTINREVCSRPFIDWIRARKMLEDNGYLQSSTL